MDRAWYLRFGVVLTALVLGVCNLWPTFADWGVPGVPEAPAFIAENFDKRISKGLDMQGGLRLMYEIEIDAYLEDKRDRLAESLLETMGRELGVFDDDDAPTREELEQTRERVRVTRLGESDIKVKFTTAADTAKLSRELLDRQYGLLRETARGDDTVELTMREDRLDELRKNAVDQTTRTISNRIDELAIKEMTVIGRDTDIIIEIPGADQATFDRIRGIIARTARLEFLIVDDENSSEFWGAQTLPEGFELRSEQVSAGERTVAASYVVARGPESRTKMLEFVGGLTVADGNQVAISRLEGAQSENEDEEAEEAWRTYYLYSSTNVTGEDIEESFVAFDQQENRPFVSIKFQPTGAQEFGDLTSRNVKRRMAIVLDQRVESAPVIQEAITGGNCRITLGWGAGQELSEQANELVIVLNAGALPAPIRPANEQLIGPTLGTDSVAKGSLGALIGIGIVLLFMAFYYQVAGLVADVMVVMNVMLLLSILAFVEGTLTLPGIAGIALTVGMAVDANVLITERIREELRAAKSPRAAVDQGFRRALWSVLDSQITTFIAGVVLYQYGTGPIRGFAVTLMIGILTSLFTGLFCSKVMLDWIVRGLKVQKLHVG